MGTVPSWLGTLARKDEKLRSHHGLSAAKDGWYKWHGGKKRYIAKPMALDDVIKRLAARLDEIDGKAAERPVVLSVTNTSIKELAEMFLAHLWQRHTTGSPKKLVRHTYDDYLVVLGKFVKVVGPSEPAITADPTWFSRYMRTISKLAATSKNRHLIYITAFFNWAGPGRHSLNFYKEPVQFGPDFRKPAEAMKRKERADYSTLYTADQFEAAMRAVAPCPLLYAMGLLGLNCAFIPEDLTTIPLSAIDFAAGVHTFPRGKTGIARKAVLMPQTIEALQLYLKERPDVGADAPLFLRADGKSYNTRETADHNTAQNHGNTLSRYWSGATGRQLKGLRTTFRTHAGGCIDRDAVDLVMGHEPDSIGEKFYVKHFDLGRLRTVNEHVWAQVACRVPPPAAASIGPSALARPASGKRGQSSKPESPPAGSENAAA